MPNVNKVFLVGHLTRDPELKYTPSGTAVAQLSLAVNRSFKKGEEWKTEVCFVDVTVWRERAEKCAKDLTKGGLVIVEGRLNYREWESGDGKRSKLDVVADNIQFVPKAKQERTAAAPKVLGEEEFIPF
jgi:single-strand DNA-binding protein